MSFTYVASPYSDPDPAVMEQRYLDIKKVMKRLIDLEYIVYSPIMHFHPLTVLYTDLGRDAKFWEEHNYKMLASAKSLLVIEMEGWRESKGIQGEIETAKSLDIPIYFREVLGA